MSVGSVPNSGMTLHTLVHSSDSFSCRQLGKLVRIIKKAVSTTIGVSRIYTNKTSKTSTIQQ